MKLVKLFSLPALLIILSSYQSQAKTTVSIESPDNTEHGSFAVFSGISPDITALKLFGRAHPFVNNARWSLSREGFTAKYTEDGRIGIEYYNSDGTWRASMRYLPLNQVPDEIVTAVYSAYNKFTIFFAQDLRTPAGFVHIIKIENGNAWKTLAINDAGISVIEEFNKQ